MDIRVGFCGVEALGFFKDASVLGFGVDVADGLGMSSALVLRVFICDDAGAARSAARDASCGVVGGAGGACHGAVGLADLTGSMIGLVSRPVAVTNIAKTYSRRIVLMQSRSGSAGST